MHTRFPVLCPVAISYYAAHWKFLARAFSVLVLILFMLSPKPAVGEDMHMYADVGTDEDQ